MSDMYGFSCRFLTLILTVASVSCGDNRPWERFEPTGVELEASLDLPDDVRLVEGDVTCREERVTSSRFKGERFAVTVNGFDARFDYGGFNAFVDAIIASGGERFEGLLFSGPGTVVGFHPEFAVRYMPFRFSREGLGQGLVSELRAGEGIEWLSVPEGLASCTVVVRRATEQEEREGRRFPGVPVFHE